MVDETPRPSASSGSGNPPYENSSPSAEWAAEIKDSAIQDLANGAIGATEANALCATADFAERNHVSGVVAEGNMWGFGTFPIMFEPDGGHGFMTALQHLMEPTGCDYTTLHREFERDYEDDYPGVDMISWVDADGIPRHLEIVDHAFCMRILAGVSPWSKEFNRNMQATFRRAFINSGTAEALGTFTIADEGSEPFEVSAADIVLRGEPLPTEEEAVTQAFRGPGGAL